jgi:dTDP-glucose pyrophosphorylase
MVAGLSSRFEGKAKALAKITENESLIEYSLNQALPSGFNKIIFIVSDKTKPLFEERFGDSYKNIPIHYALQDHNSEKRDRPWGTLDALCSAAHLLNESFVICNGDDLYGKDTFKILHNHLENNENEEGVTAGYYLKDVLPKNGAVNRGIFQITNSYVTKIEEQLGIHKDNLKEKNLDHSHLCSMNIFGLFPSSLEKLNQILNNF